MIITWFPAAWLLIKHAGKTLYIDPAWIQNNFADYPDKVIFSHYPDPMDGLPTPNMPQADYILITHHHQDHVKTATVHRLCNSATEIFAPIKCGTLIKQPFTAIKPGDRWKIGPFDVTATYAYNTTDGHSTHKVHKRGDCVGYIVEAGGKRLYHAGDTDHIDEMRELGKIDVAFLPVGGTFTMNCSEAVEAAQTIKAQINIPMHFLHESPRTFASYANKSGIKYKILGIGDSIEI